ncbi:glycosyltransferase [Psychrobacter sp. T6-5]|uniref:glycosyltransferase n=1 Tax=Psychrobacter sp. T6-5 TaxID=3457451 RepID=UPI003FCFAA11
MKVVYFITASKEGKGGHYHSLNETAKIFNKYEDIEIISIGVNRSPVLDHFDDKYTHLTFKNILSTSLRALEIVRKKKPDVLHAFDINSFYYARIISIITNTPVLITLCGGKNPKFFPFSHEIVLYSLENLKFIEKKNKFKESNLSLIPNRASATQQNNSNIEDIKRNLKTDFPIVLRIARFSSLHEDSILQSIKLVEFLRNEGVETQLLVVGYVKDKKIFEDLSKYQSEYITFITDEKYTVKASQLIDIADFVVGTGRGFMEAALLGKTMLAPTSNIKTPIVVNQENVSLVSDTNFSNRYFEKRPEKLIMDEILKTFSSKDKENLIDFAKENFSSEKIYDKYLPIYLRAKTAKILPLDIAYQIAIIIRPKEKLRSVFKKFRYLSYSGH